MQTVYRSCIIEHRRHETKYVLYFSFVVHQKVLYQLLYHFNCCMDIQNKINVDLRKHGDTGPYCTCDETDGPRGCEVVWDEVDYRESNYRHISIV